ncbi:MAG: hypothetical protein JWQ88_323 [Rhodoferax sp.]|nr:hypothetical protein [Rhodoferax sp.]
MFPAAGSPARPSAIARGTAPRAMPSLPADSLLFGGTGQPLPSPAGVVPLGVLLKDMGRSTALILIAGLERLAAFFNRLAAAHAAPGQPSAAPAPPAPPVAAPAPVHVPVPTPPTTAAHGNLAQAVSGTAPGQPLALGAALFEFTDFGSDLARVRGNRTDQNGLDLPARFPGVAGAGVDRTIIRMRPHTSTKAGDVPTVPFTTNQYSLMRVTGPVNLHDFTLQSTEQGHLYNGLRMHICDNPRVTNVKITGVPGSGSSPPGETFGLSDYRTNNAIYKNLEVDGMGVGASGFGANHSTNVTIEGGYFHGNSRGIGATFWQTHNVNIIDTASVNNRNGFNFERVTGTINMVRPRIENISGRHDISFGTDRPSAKVTIIDPVLPPGKKLRISIGSIFQGGPNQQKRSDIKVIINGVDRTAEVVEFR